MNVFEVEEELLRYPDVATVTAFPVPSLPVDGTEYEIKVAVVAREESIAGRRFSEKEP